MLGGTFGLPGEMPAGLIEAPAGAACDLRGDFGQVEEFIASECRTWDDDERRALAVPGTDRPERYRLMHSSLVFRRAGARAAAWPNVADDLVLLADTGLVRKPDLYGVGLDAFFAPDLRQTLGETFLKSSMA